MSNSEGHHLPSGYIAGIKFQLKKTHTKEVSGLKHQECLHQAVHERLGELLRVLKAIISKHQRLNSVDILSTAGTVIATVKGVNFKEVNEDNKQKLFGEIYTAIDTLAFTFGNVVSDFLMGDVENGSVLGLPLTKRSRVRNDESMLLLVFVLLYTEEQDSGVESALLYAKAWSKYTKELLAWVDKRLNIECAKSYAKIAESAKTLASQQEFMPFCETYMTAFKNDVEYSQLVLHTTAILQNHKFMQPLLTRKNELDKRRKEVKEQWQREQKKMHEADGALRKARLLQAQRQEEYEKAKVSTSRLEEEQNVGGGGAAVAKQLEKRRRLEEEALQKAEEAKEHCKACQIDVGEKRVEMANTKSDIITQIREMVSQCDLTLKAVTVNWFQLQQAQVVSLPVNNQSLCENAKLYEPGQRYIDFVQNLPTDGPRLESHSFDSAVTQNTGSNQSGGMCSDSESAGGSSESRSMDSPTASPGDFKRRLPRTPSTGTMSSADDLDDREPPSPFENGDSPGPFRNTQMSKAAQTHKLRKLRAPSKCRECDSLVVFHGAECEECSLACHKKCLETLAIQCGHKKLHGRLHLFGIDFTQAANNSPDSIPFIVRKCTSEIESRALNIKGIYRVNGAKSRVEKLCQAFENGKHLVELSELYPHDISNVLKLYLRQLPEPLILFRYYNDFIGLAKESQSIIMEELEALRLSPPPVSPAQISVDLNRVLFKIRDLLRQLPPAHYKTLQFLIEHLYRVTEHSAENKMTASNLGIIFGPTLIKPRQADAEVSLSSLVDYPYQALIVELLIRHHQMIFDIPLSPLGNASPTEIVAQPRADVRLSRQDKGQQLSRHSKSMGDIKEVTGFYITQDSLGGLSRSQHVTVTRVQLRHPRSKLSSRPVSLPAERTQGRGQVDENNTRNSADQEDLKVRSCYQSIEEVDETENPKSRAGAHYRSTFIDTQTLRRTWDKQYKHEVATKTVKVVASSPADGAEVDASHLSASVPLSSSVFSFGNTEGAGNAAYPNRPFTVTVRPNRTLKREDNVTKYSLVTKALRAPRTLQPPPGTFYKPPSGSKSKIPQNSALANSAEEEEEDEEEDDEDEDELGIEIEVSVDEPVEEDAEEAEQAAVSPSSSPEQLGQNPAKPVYQRLRPRRLPEIEHREAHFV
uniref:Rho GTPase-activating protein 29 n=1 Tax=Takifugu rubripes TaxID=31033 RepID=A0A674PIL1_TAKRU